MRGTNVFKKSFSFIVRSLQKTLMNDRKFSLGVIIMITLGTAFGVSAILQPLQQHSAYAKQISDKDIVSGGASQPAISGDNIYVVWFTNKSGNWEVMFRASTDGGKTFGDKINLSNSTDADSTRAQIDSDANSVVVTWWETNQTSDFPVMRISTDNGKTFGERIMLSANGPIG